MISVLYSQTVLITVYGGVKIHEVKIKIIIIIIIIKIIINIFYKLRIPTGGRLTSWLFTTRGGVEFGATEAKCI